ncbi:MAG: DEAD/DEAH box helicase [Clostridiales bacterium]|nr:DEAD/DEAH box helicase [Clostridiales bacterium]
MMSDIFGRLAPFIKDYIYRSGWDSLRGIQLEAARILFDTDDNLLITSGTASGKTEAAFLPILTELHEAPSASVGVLYIAPLKSLINDQFARMEELLDESGIPVYHWHGDVAMSHKTKALKNPSGILQITPESLEGMLMNRSNDIVRLFCDLRYIIIDEVHILTGSDRGNQIICQLTRLGRLIGYHPRRVGLSATVGDVRLAAEWLGGGSGRQTRAPIVPEGRLKWRLALEHFYIQNPSADQTSEEPVGLAGGNLLPDTDADTADADAGTEPNRSGEGDSNVAALDAGYEYIYDCAKDRKCLVFSNSREETEYITATLRQIAEYRGEPDVFSIHHGNLSASIREEAELDLKNDEKINATCATVTLELGIDIGRLERVIQLGSPHSVSSFLQRLGRSGRRGQPPEMIEVFREETALPNAPLPNLIPWNLLRAIAIIQLYIEERFIEPPQIKHLPFSLMFHQTLSILAASGGLDPKELASRVMTLPPFSEVPKEYYKSLLISMIKNDYIQQVAAGEEGGRPLIVGLRGERLINSFRFLAVFKDTEDFTVRCESDEIGTITTPPPVGDRFALAGRVWEVEELDVLRRLIYVRRVPGKMEVSWPGDYGEIHTRIQQRMRRVLEEDTVYPYLKPNARRRIEVARALARNTGITRRSLVPLGGYTYCMLPWLGTRSFRTLRKFIVSRSRELKLSNLEFEGCCFMTFRMEKGSEADLLHHLCAIVESEGIDRQKLVSSTEIPVFEKFDTCIPGDLLRAAYAADRLRTDEAEKRLIEMRDEEAAYVGRRDLTASPLPETARDKGTRLS